MHFFKSIASTGGEKGTGKTSFAKLTFLSFHHRMQPPVDQQSRIPQFESQTIVVAKVCVFFSPGLNAAPAQVISRVAHLPFPNENLVISEPIGEPFQLSALVVFRC